MIQFDTYLFFSGFVIFCTCFDKIPLHGDVDFTFFFVDEFRDAFEKKKGIHCQDMFCMVENAKYMSIGFNQTPLHDKVFYIQIRDAKGEKIDPGHSEFLRIVKHSKCDH